MVEEGARVPDGVGTVEGVVELLMHSFRGGRVRFWEVVREKVEGVVEE